MIRLRKQTRHADPDTRNRNLIIGFPVPAPPPTPTSPAETYSVDGQQPTTPTTDAHPARQRRRALPRHAVTSASNAST